MALHALVFLSFFAIPSFAGEGAFCEYDLSDGGRVRVDVLDEGLFRVRRMENGEWPESGLTRYSILKTDWQAPKSFRRTATGRRRSRSGARRLEARRPRRNFMWTRRRARCASARSSRLPT